MSSRSLSNGSSILGRYGPGSSAGLPDRDRWTILYNDSGKTMFIPEKTQAERTAVYNNFPYKHRSGPSYGVTSTKKLYANTTGAYSANVYVHTDGSFNRATSSRRYKTDIVDATKGLDEILQLKPRNYRPKNDRTDSPEPNAEINDPHLDAENRIFAGLIAE